MVASGLPISNGNKHAVEISTMALHFMSSIKVFKIRHMPLESLAIRIGIHSGKRRFNQFSIRHLTAHLTGVAQEQWLMFEPEVRRSACDGFCRSGGCRSGRHHHASLLSLWWHGQHGLPHGEQQLTWVNWNYTDYIHGPQRWNPHRFGREVEIAVFILISAQNIKIFPRFCPVQPQMSEPEQQVLTKLIHQVENVNIKSDCCSLLYI